jgi:peptidyl-prolyl cis-trans isomerase A (cyclophilin A)
MKVNLLSIFVFFFIAAMYSQQTVMCSIKTSLGIIEVQLYPEQAPLTVSNFLQYTDKGAYTNSSFFRVCNPENEANREVKIEVIQGGNVSQENMLPPIPLETTQKTGILHKDGVISMARSSPDSATSSFFICINDQPELDFNGKRNLDGKGFAAFGKVIKGMDIVRNIQSLGSTDQYLTTPVVIESITRQK